MISVNVTGVDQVRAMLSQIGKQLANKALSQTAVQVENYIEQEAAKHNKTGALVRSIYKTRLADGSWEIGHDPRHAPHAAFVVGPTKAHDIKPKNKQALRYARGGIFWFWFGPQESKQDKARIYAWIKKKGYGTNTRVMFRWPHHPGYAGDPYIQRACAMAPQIFQEKVLATLQRIDRAG